MLLPETRAALARYDAWLAGVMRSPERLALRTRQFVGHLARRIRNMVLGMLGVVFLAFLYGNLVAPIGFLGLLLMLFAMLGVSMVLATWPPARPAGPPAPKDAPLATQASRLVSWLEQARLSLPVGVVGDLDRLIERLHELTPELQRLPADSPEADDARRLLVGHLPRLVETYRQLPPTARAEGQAQAHFREGLQVVATELARLSTAISAERLRALETEGRFLGSRYGKPAADDR